MARLIIIRGATHYQQDLLQTLRQIATQSDTIIRNQEAMITSQQSMLADLHDVVTISRIQQDLPPQISLSAPIVFLDARGRRAGFFLEFIDSVEVNILPFAYTSRPWITNERLLGLYCRSEDSFRGHWTAQGRKRSIRA